MNSKIRKEFINIFRTYANYKKIKYIDLHNNSVKLEIIKELKEFYVK